MTNIILNDIHLIIENNYFKSFDLIYEELGPSEKKSIDQILTGFKNSIKDAKDPDSLVSIIKETCSDMIEEFKNSDMRTSITFSYFLVIMAGLLNTAIGYLLTLIAAPLLGVAVGSALFEGLYISISASVVGPIVEEELKRISVKSKSTLPHLIIFNIMEFLQYVRRGVNPFVRIIPVFLHFLNNLIHKRSDMLGKDKDGSDYKDTVKYHMINNAGSMVVGGLALGVSKSIFVMNIAVISLAILNLGLQLYKLSTMKKESKNEHSK